jgi:cyclophilin family peptidyl-prolyl cis-trans isomerase
MRAVTAGLLAVTLCVAARATEPNPEVRILTEFGAIDIELFIDKAPLSVQNFLAYVDDGFYDRTLFHRVVEGTLIQGGGYAPDMTAKPVHDPIYNEADNGLKNLAGTVAMGRGRGPLSATSQFFINTVDNAEFDFRYNTVEGWGYAVFGKVTAGMNVVRKIETVETKFWPFEEKPSTEILVHKIERRK